VQKASKSKQRAGVNEYGARMDQKRSIVREEGSVDNRIPTASNTATRNHQIGGSRERTISKDRNNIVFTSSMMTRTSVSGLKTTMAV
jgi:hypothetical protein